MDLPYYSKFARETVATTTAVDALAVRWREELYAPTLGRSCRLPHACNVGA